MEFLVGFAILLILVVFSSVFYLRVASQSPSLPTPLPIIGHLYLLGKLPHHSLLAIARKYGPLVQLQLGSVPVVIASSPEMAREFLRNQDLSFASRPTLLTTKYILYDSKDMVFAPYGEHWRSMRKLCVVELLTDRRLASSQQARLEELQRLLAKIAKVADTSEPFVLLDLLTEFTFNVITRMVMNKAYFGSGETTEELAATRDFIHMQEQGTILLGEFHIGDYIPFLKWFDSSVAKMKALHKIQDEFLQKVVDQHVLARQSREQTQAHDGDGDFVDTLLSLDSPDPNNQARNIKALIQNLLGAGTDTSITTIQWAMAELLNNPRALEKAQEELRAKFGNARQEIIQEHELQDLPYLHAVIKETFRLHPPAPLLIPHQSTQDITVAGLAIAKGTRLFVNVYAIGRDPALWKSPDDFLPERFLGSSIDVHGKNFELLPFGSGRRGCPGMVLGLITVQLALANLPHRFQWSLAPGVDAHPMAECFGVATTMEIPLRVRASPNKN
ncbi:hypothetical protein SELMODRAFT_78293 [Selaginella moellendorffii]|uniref:Uncharacterized protein CYP795A2 n=1 Tax=Selaginella moellendorffii TaxID=88036 RepID=D8QUX8_SELML|nr:cytochrome P450 71A1 [Selaginella moellendorffii]EFJ35949.1 hypothetical protein SELMODRAFT_78293 [Selaginella moellendorffii]|eukprot:XP_002962486.1 cytochrome P450 71A1 [Selaginella moellendorffii]